MQQKSKQTISWDDSTQLRVAHSSTVFTERHSEAAESEPAAAVQERFFAAQIKQASQTNDRNEQQKAHFKGKPITACRKQGGPMDRFEQRMMDQVHAVRDLAQPDQRPPAEGYPKRELQPLPPDSTKNRLTPI